MWLQRDFGIYVANLFDTGQAARVLQHKRLGLAYLLEHYCNVKVIPPALHASSQSQLLMKPTDSLLEFKLQNLGFKVPLTVQASLPEKHLLSLFPCQLNIWQPTLIQIYHTSSHSLHMNIGTHNTDCRLTPLTSRSYCSEMAGHGTESRQCHFKGGQEVPAG